MQERKMRVGVIGAGAISEIYLQNMTSVFDNLEVVGVAANHIESAKKRADQFGIQAYTTADMLADKTIEMVVILTPVGAHYGLIKQALEAGKHVYTEKTITDDPAKAAQLLELADEKGLYLGAAPDTFLGAAWQTARRAIDSGLIGDIHSFVISGNRKNDILMSVFAFLRQPGAGILNDYGVYYLTALVSLLGPVKRAGGIIGKPYPTHVNIFPQSPDFGKVMETPVESQVSAVLQLENGITGTFHIDADSNLADTAYFAVYGTKGILYLTDPNQFGGTIKYLPDSVDFRTPARPIELWNFARYSENSRGIGPSDLAKAVMEGRPVRPSKEMAAHVLEVLTAIAEGEEFGKFTDILSTCERPAPLPLSEVGAKNLGHVSFNMKNPEAMLNFYQNVLGMKEQFYLTYGDLLGMIREDLEKKAGTENSKGNEDTEAAGVKNDTAYKNKADDKNDTADDNKEHDKNTDMQSPEEMIRGLEAVKDQKWLTYLKLGDRQFLELFYPNESLARSIDNRVENYGYFKLNYEVESIEAIREELIRGGVELTEEIHTTLDGAREIAVKDPDGNVVQFTEYPKGADARIKMPPVPEEHSCSHVQYTTQVAYNIQDAVNMENFYCLGLGLKKVFSLRYSDMAAAMEASGKADPQMLLGMKMMGENSWIDYIEVAPHQYIELFHTDGRTLNEDRNLADSFGYQHICIEVEDIHKAWDAVINNGLTPDTEIRLGPEGAYQFWLVDPDGNRLELMEYTDHAMQLTGR